MIHHRIPNGTQNSFNSPSPSKANADSHPTRRRTPSPPRGWPIFNYFVVALVLCILISALVYAASPNLDLDPVSTAATFSESTLDSDRKIFPHHHAAHVGTPPTVPTQLLIDAEDISSAQASELLALIRRTHKGRALTGSAAFHNASLASFKLPSFFDPTQVRKAAGVDFPLVLDIHPWPPYQPIDDFLRRNRTWVPHVPPDVTELRALTSDFLAFYHATVVLDPVRVDNVTLRAEWAHVAAYTAPYPHASFKGRGVVIPGGGAKYSIAAWINLRMLRYLGCTLPIELWVLSGERMTPGMEALLALQGVRIRMLSDVYGDDAPQVAQLESNGYAFKAAALFHASFEEALVLDADVNAVLDPTQLFEFGPYRTTGAMLWKDFWRLAPSEYSLAQAVFALSDADVRRWAGGNSGAYPGAYAAPRPPERHRKLTYFEFTLERVQQEHHAMQDVLWSVDSGVMLVHKRKVWRALLPYLYMNLRSDGYHGPVTVPNQIGTGDKETLPMALRVLGMPYYLVETPAGVAGMIDRGHTMVQYKPNSTQPMFLHRNCQKLRGGTLGFAPERERSWSILAHVPPKISTHIIDGAADIFWKCAVSVSEDGLLRQPFVSIFPGIDVERTISLLGTELLQSEVFDQYILQQKQARGSYTTAFGHASRNSNARQKLDAKAAGGLDEGPGATRAAAAGKGDRDRESDRVAPRWGPKGGAAGVTVGRVGTKYHRHRGSATEQLGSADDGGSGGVVEAQRATGASAEAGSAAAAKSEAQGEIEPR